MLAKRSTQGLLEVVVIPLFQDNYSYAIFNDDSRSTCSLIDPADTARVMDFLNVFSKTHVSSILYTHKHYDHIGNPKDLIDSLRNSSRLLPDFKVVASSVDGKSIPTLTYQLFGSSSSTSSTESVEKNAFLEIEGISVPCHTAGHVLYHCKQAGTIDEKKDQNEVVLHKTKENGYLVVGVDECLFTGDTLFIGGCGRFMEGNATQMLDNMDRITRLSNKNLKIFCAHEYTKSNYEWAAKIERENAEMQARYARAVEDAKNSVPSIPSVLRDEIATNIFMRCRTKELASIFKSADPVFIMGTLRTMKNAGIVDVSTIEAPNI